MLEFALLMKPSANAVFGDSSVALSLAELGILNANVANGCLQEIQAKEIEGLPFVSFQCEDLDAPLIERLSDLTFVFALFQVDAQSRLLPIRLKSSDKYSGDLITIQKYRGKTNPDFTKLLLNIARYSAGTAEQSSKRTLRVFDPLCGRGTTLNQALMFGYDCAGIEIDQSLCDAYFQFLKKWAKDNRLKHAAQSMLMRENKRTTGKKYSVEIAPNKTEFKSGLATKLEVACTDTRNCREIYSKNTFDMIATDLPYGIVHRSEKTNEVNSRRPIDLLIEALPQWKETVRAGGVIAIAWNTRLANREKVKGIFRDVGLEVLDEAGYGQLRHVVDSAITRDIMVGKVLAE